MAKTNTRLRPRRFLAIMLAIFLFIAGAVLLKIPDTSNRIGNLFGSSAKSVAADMPARGDGLDRELGARMDAAMAAAADQGIDLYLNSGKRSFDEQQALFDDAVAEHGSEAEAARWVMRPEDSAHVTGLAIDVGPWEGMTWLAEQSSEFGLCLVYENEPWHFEVHGEIGDECPALLSDAAG